MQHHRRLVIEPTDPDDSLQRDGRPERTPRGMVRETAFQIGQLASMHDDVDRDAAFCQGREQPTLHGIRIGEQHDHARETSGGQVPAIDGASGDRVRQVKPMLGEFGHGLFHDGGERRPDGRREELTQFASGTAIAQCSDGEARAGEFLRHLADASCQGKQIGVDDRVAQKRRHDLRRALAQRRQSTKACQRDRGITRCGAIGHDELGERSTRRENGGQEDRATRELLQVAGQ